MTVLALVLLALATAAPALALPLRRTLADPTIVVAATTAVLLALAAVAAALADVHPGWRHAAALTLGVAAATTGGSDVVRAAFRLIRGDTAVRRVRRPNLATEPAEPARGGAPNKPDEQREANTARLVEVDEPSLETALRGGAWIGYLERAAISATLLAGWPEGIALVLALKGVGRYPELKEPSPSSTNAPEAFIIGTLVSVLWAAGAAGTASLLV